LNLPKNKKMRITIILPGWITKNFGGAEWQSYLLSEKFLEHGWKVQVLTARSLDEININYRNPKVEYYYYPFLKIKSIRFLAALYYMFKVKADYYYTRTDDKIFRSAAILVSRYRKSKVIYAIAGDDELEYSKFDYQKYKGKLLYWFKFLDYKLVNYIVKNKEHKADLVVCQTNYQQKKLFENKQINSVVIPNSFLPFTKNLDTKEKENIVLWVGNMRPVKRPEVFLEIASLSKHINYKFVMIGGNTSYLEKFTIPDNVMVLGQLDRLKTSELFAKSKFLINTSLTEGFSNTFFEAWFYKLQILTLGVNPDCLFSKKKLGRSFSSVKELVLNLEKSILNDVVLTDVDRNKKYLLQNFQLSKNFQKLINCIENC
jgi:glycosyltransferase involved in cell wall biosynthesis